MGARLPHARRLFICADAADQRLPGTRMEIELQRLPTTPGCRSPYVTSRQEPANGTKSSIGYSVTLLRIGAAGPSKAAGRRAAPSAAAAAPRRPLRSDRTVFDDRAYPKGPPDGANPPLASLPLTRHDFHGEWNYTLQPE